MNTAGDCALKKGNAIKANEKKHNERRREMIWLGEPNQNSQKDMDFLIKQRLQGTQSLLNGSLSSVLQVHL